MTDIYQEHVAITSQVKQIIENEKIVFPAKYGKIYHDIARNRDIELNAEELFTAEMLDEKMVRHVITLAACSDKALDAMEKEDKEALKLVIAETKALRDEIRELQKIVYEDTLTRSYNRKWFEDTYLEGGNLSLRESGTLVLVDINDFKTVNDTYGHVIGDKVLIHIAIKLKESGGRIVRYGGDEFLVIFDAAVSSDTIHQKMQNILDYFHHISFKVNNHSFKSSFAYGMASFTGTSNIEAVIEEADKAMYRHKKAMH